MRILLAGLLIWAAGWGCPLVARSQPIASEAIFSTSLPPTPVVTNRFPLLETPFAALPLGSVHPLGWLLTQCQLQRDGLTGNAETLYANDLGTNSAWLGGTGENWERSPYYYKGLVALAYVLDDPGLKQKAQKWMDWLLDHQRTYGYIGPGANPDWWPRMVATYALRDYYEATGDARVPVVLSNYFNYMRTSLPTNPLKDWGKARAGDEIDVALWLYNRNGDTNLLALADLLRKQAYDWIGIFTSNSFDLYGTDFQPKHNVNVAQALKFPAVYYQLSRKPADLRALSLGLDQLMRENALPCGINSGTEFLSGNASIQGVELCSIVEAMLSLETSVCISGDPKLADRLETISFNALPAALANEIKGLQYYTLPNNVIAINGGHGFNQDYANATLPGPESGYPCCRYNLHMGWPKLVQNSWAATPDAGLAALVYAPTVVNTLVNGHPIQITEDTAYPFEEQIRLRISLAHPVAFPLTLRIPGWCTNATITINGETQNLPAPATFLRLPRTWSDGDHVTLNFPMPIATTQGPERSVAISRGPLIYSLRIGEQWDIRTPDPRHLGFDEFEIHPTTPWNFALQLDPTHPAAAFTITTNFLPQSPFDPAQSPALHARARLIPTWTTTTRGTHAFEPPVSPVASDSPPTDVTLVPFGAQHLRLSWFPWLGPPRPITGNYTEKFDPTWPQRWTTFGGNWTIRNHTISTVPASANGAKALALATAYTNLTYEADIAVGPRGNAGLIFRASQPDIGADAYCGYYAGLSAERNRLEFGYASNTWHPILELPTPIAANTYYHLKITARDAQIRIYLNHNKKPALEITDPRATTGAIGIRDYCSDADHSLSSFTNLRVTELLPGAN